MVMFEQKIYEKLLKIFGKAKIPVPSLLRKKYEDEILFCNLDTTPEEIFSTAILFPIFFIGLTTLLFYLLNFLSFTMIFIELVFFAVVTYYLLYYPSFLTIYYRNKASSEMAMAIIYMSISMKINKNLEDAIAFAANNLSGPLGYDFKKILWKLQTREIVSAQDALDYLIRKWRAESEEFIDALELIKTSIDEPVEKMEHNLKEAVDIVLTGTKTRMKKYAMEMRTPLKIISTFGILLPLLFLIFLPILIIFIPSLSSPELIIFGYDIFLPAIIFLLLRQHYYTRPYSYHQIEMENIEKFRRQKKVFGYLFSITGIGLFIYFAFLCFKSSGLFSVNQFIYSLLSVISIGMSVSLYHILFFRFIQRNEEIEQIESELPVALFQLSVISSSGRPLESILEKLLPHIREMKIKKFFLKIISKIRSFGSNLEDILFNEKNGIILEYPSRILRATMKIMVDISKRGSFYLSSALKSISSFLRDADDVNKETDEILSDITSEIQVINLIFAPVTSGIVVGLMAIVIFLFAAFGQSLQDVENFLAGSAFKGIGTSYEFLFNIGKQTPFSYFQISVGIYLIEIVYMLSSFLGEIKYGENEVKKIVDVGKSLLIAIFLYSIIVSLLYFGVSSMINPAELGVLQ